MKTLRAITKLAGWRILAVLGAASAGAGARHGQAPTSHGSASR